MAYELTWKNLFEQSREQYYGLERLNERLEKENEKLKHRIAFLVSTKNEYKSKKRKRKNDIGLRVIDGGRKIEDQPSFVNKE